MPIDLQSRLVSADPTRARARGRQRADQTGSGNGRSSELHPAIDAAVISAAREKACRGREPMQAPRAAPALPPRVSLAVFTQPRPGECGLLVVCARRPSAKLLYVLRIIQNSECARRQDIPHDRGTEDESESEIETDDLPVLFLGFHPRPPCGFRNFYWLQLIEEDTAIDGASNFFTLTTRGITHFQHANAIEFASLAQWLEEKQAFDAMTAMGGLHKLQQRLFFWAWKRYAVHNRHERMRARLACRLFHCDVTAARILLVVRRHLMIIEEQAACNVFPNGVAFSLGRLDEIQRDYIQTMKSVLHTQLDSISKVIVSEWTEQLREAEMDRDAGLIAATARGRLYSFLRLVELQRFESLVTIVRATVRRWHHAICGNTRACNPQVSSEIVPTLRTCDVQLDGEGNQDKIEYRTRFCLRDRMPPSPLLCIRLEIDKSVQLDQAPNVFAHPAVAEAFTFVHSWLDESAQIVDEAPTILADPRFDDALGPMARPSTHATLSKPSEIALAASTLMLQEMRNALDTYFKQTELVVTEHRKLVHDMQQTAIEGGRDCNRDYASAILELDASQFERAHTSWQTFLQSVCSAPKVQQVGCLLLQQENLLATLNTHISTHLRVLIEALPQLYRTFLAALLNEAGERLDSITTIPISITDAITWLQAVLQMLPSHEVRDAFDAQCANVTTFQMLLKSSMGLDQQAVTPEDHAALKNMDAEWEALLETLLIFLARAQESDGEHRRALQVLTAKTDDQVARELQELRLQYSRIGPWDDAIALDRPRMQVLSQQQDDILSRLEQLVEVDEEKQEMLSLLARLEEDQRVIGGATDNSSFSTASSSSSASTALTAMRVSLCDAKMPSEQFQQHVSVVFEIWTCYASWLQLERKWRDSALASVHPGMIQSRVRQFRRRTRDAATKMLHPVFENDNIPNGQEQDQVVVGFLLRDEELVKRFLARLDEMTEDARIFQAVASTAFADAQWKTLAALADTSRANITLRRLQDCSNEARERVRAMCDCVLVEAQLQATTAQLQKQLAASRIEASIANYRVTLRNLPTVALELHDLQVAAALLAQRGNPRLAEVQTLQHVLAEKLELCEQVRIFAGRWNDVCELTRLHDVEEFFTGPLGWKTPHRQSDAGTDDAVWTELARVAHDWRDRLRRLFCLSTSANAIASGGEDASAPAVSAAFATTLCTLDDFQAAFDGFAFDVCSAVCQQSESLVRRYLRALLDKCPRLSLLSNEQLVRLLVHDDDDDRDEFQAMLHTCFPQICSFDVARPDRTATPKLDESDSAPAMVEGGKNGSLELRGLKCAPQTRLKFRVPVVRLGRLKFWWSRLEDEISTLVVENLRLAVTRVLGDDADSELVPMRYDDLLPQSIWVALCVRFALLLPAAAEEDTSYEWSEAIVQQLCDQQHAFLRQQVENRDAAIKEGLAEMAALESAILVSQCHTQVLRDMVEALHAGHDGVAAACWDAQWKLRIIATDAAQHSEVLDASGWRDLRLNPMPPAVTFVADIGRLRFPVGREFIGMARAPIVTPLTQRCVFELMHAVAANPLSLIVPTPRLEGRYDQPLDHSGHYSTRLLAGIAQVLMRFCTTIDCRLQRVDVGHLDNLVRMVTAMDGFLVLQHIAGLAASLTRALEAQLTQHVQFARANQSVSVHIESYPVASIFLPCDRPDLERTALVAAISTDFHPIALLLPSVEAFTRAMAMAAGYLPEQLPMLATAVSFFVRLSSTLHRADIVYPLITLVLRDTFRLRASARVLLPETSAAREWTSKYRGRKRVLFRRSQDAHDVAPVVLHTIFRRTIEHSYGTLISIAHQHHVQTPDMTVSGQATMEATIARLLDECFPEALGCEVIDTSMQSADETAMCAAIELALEDAGLAVTGVLLEQCEALWRLLTLESARGAAVLVLGEVGAGKSTCIQMVHRAYCALRLAAAQESESKTVAPPALAILNPLLLALGSDEQGRFGEEVVKQYLTAEADTWICLDGVVDGAVGERVLFRMAQSGCCGGPQSPRVLFETISVADASPAFVAKCGVLPLTSSVTCGDLVTAWARTWSTRLQLEAQSAEREHWELLLRLLRHLLGGAVMHFARAEESTVATSAATASFTPSSATPPPMPTHIGMASLFRLTQGCLTLIASLCLQHRVQWEALTPLQLGRLVVFCVVWAFAGHLTDKHRIRLDNALRNALKEIAPVRALADAVGQLHDSERLVDYWEAISLPVQGLDRSPHAVNLRCVYDAASSSWIAIPRSAIGVLRVARLLMQAKTSFLIAGPRGSGKTSLLKLLLLLQQEDHAGDEELEASLKQYQATGIIDWMDKPSAWFGPPSTHSVRNRAHEDALLLAKRHASGALVFLDDLALPSGDRLRYVEEFARIASDHGVCMDWRNGPGRVAMMNKALGGALHLREAAVSGMRFQAELERVVRPFQLLHVPTLDRLQMQSVFRVRYCEHMEDGVVGVNRANGATTNGHGNGRDKVLSLSETLLRATVDLALEFQSSSPSIPPLAFNWHHVDAILKRALQFAKSLGVPTTKALPSFANSERGPAVSAAASSSTGTGAGGPSLLSLGKLHQAWVSEVSSILVTLCPRISTISPDGHERDKDQGSECDRNVDEMPRVDGLLRMLSEKYFSVPTRGDDRAVVVARDVAYEAHAFCQVSTYANDTYKAMLAEVLASNASASSTAASTSTSNRTSSISTMRSRVQSTLDAVRELVGAMALDAFLLHKPKAEAERREWRIRLSSTLCLHRLLHILHAITSGYHVALAKRDLAILKPLLETACVFESFVVVSLGEFSDLEHVLLLAGTQNTRAVLWAEQGKPRDAIWTALEQWLQVLCAGHLPPALLLSSKLRLAIADACTRDGSALSVLGERDAIAWFCARLRANLRVVVVADHNTKNPIDTRQDDDMIVPALLSSMNDTAHFRWVGIPSAKDLGPIIVTIVLQEIALHVVREMAGIEAARQRDQSISLPSEWAPLVSACVEQHLSALGDRAFASLETFMMFLLHLHSRFIQRRAELEITIRDSRALATALRDQRAYCDQLQQRLPCLDRQLQRLRSHRAIRLDVAGGRTSIDHIRDQHQDNDQDHDEEADAAAREYHCWVMRAAEEECELEFCEAELHQREFLEFVHEWTATSTTQDELIERHERELASCLECVAMPHEIARQALDEAANIAYGCEHMWIDASGDSGALIERLWTSRFPFFEDRHSRSLVRAADRMEDRLPWLVDASGLLQLFLTHVFSGIAWFAMDAPSDRATDRKPPIAMVVHCRDRAKTLRKLQEAQQKDMPVLLVEPDEHLLAQVVDICSTVSADSAYRPRQPLLDRLTRESFALQLRINEAAAKRASGAVAAVLSRSSGSNAGAGFAFASAVAAAKAQTQTPRPSVSRRVSVDTDKNTGVGLGSPKQGAPALGFQVYVVSTHAPSSGWQNANARSIAVVSIAWPARQIEAFFLQHWTSKREPSLLRQVTGLQCASIEAQWHVLAAEVALQRVANVDAALDRIGFSHQLAVLAQALQHQRVQDQRAQERLPALALEQQAFSPVASQLGHLAIGMARFARILQPSALYLRHCRFWTQLVDRSLVRLAQQDHDQEREHVASSRIDLADDPASSPDATETDDRVLKDVLHMALASLLSTSHRALFSLVLRSDIAQLRAFVSWIGSARVTRPLLPAHASEDPMRGTPPPRSLADRLRRKVQLCMPLVLATCSEDTTTKHLPRTTSLPHTALASLEAILHASIADSSDKMAHVPLRAAVSALSAIWHDRQAVRHAQQASFSQALAAMGIADATQYEAIATMNLRGAGCTIQLESFDVGMDEVSQTAKMLRVATARTRHPHRLSAALSAMVADPNESKTDDCRIDDMLAITDCTPLPPLPELAWSRLDLEHLPTQVVAYESRARLLLELSLLQASLHAVTIYSLESADADVDMSPSTRIRNRALDAIRQELTARITSRECFAVEVVHADDAMRVMTLVSQLINQHALLCAPTWLLICSVDVLDSLPGNALAFLRVYVVRPIANAKESKDATLAQLTRWLTQAHNVAERDARCIATEITRQLQEAREYRSGAWPLRCQLRAWLALHRHDARDVTQRSAVAPPPPTLSRFESLSVEADVNAGDVTISVDADASDIDSPAQQSMEVVADCTMMQAALEDQDDNESKSISAAMADDVRLPATVASALPVLRSLATNTRDLVNDPSAGWVDPAPAATSTSELLSKGFLRDECLQHVVALEAFCCCCETAQAYGSTRSGRGSRYRSARRRLVLLAQGLVPSEFLVDVLPNRSRLLQQSMVSIAQLLLLLVSRIAFTLQLARDNASIASVRLSLVAQPQRLFEQLYEASRRHRQCQDQDQDHQGQTQVDAAMFGLRLCAPAKSDARDKASARRFACASLNASSQTGKPGMIELDASGTLCGICVDGLLLVERLHGKNGRIVWTRMHALPLCVLECRNAMDKRKITDSARSAVNVRCRLAMIASRSTCQQLPEHLWSSPSRACPTGHASVDRSVLVELLFVPLSVVPGLHHPTEGEHVDFAVAGPLLVAEEDELAL